MKIIYSIFLSFVSINVFAQNVEQINIDTITNVNDVIQDINNQINSLPKGEGFLGWSTWVYSSIAILFNILVWLGVVKYYKKDV